MTSEIARKLAAEILDEVAMRLGGGCSTTVLAPDGERFGIILRIGHAQFAITSKEDWDARRGPILGDQP
jgi:hypothetical protein